jgi:hypothetical protein
MPDQHGIWPALNGRVPEFPGFLRRRVIGSVKQRSESPAESTTYFCVEARPPEMETKE